MNFKKKNVIPLILVLGVSIVSVSLIAHALVSQKKLITPQVLAQEACSCTLRTGSAGSTSTVTCVGYGILITGGCDGPGGTRTGPSYPIDNGWGCKQGDIGVNVTAHAWCCQ